MAPKRRLSTRMIHDPQIVTAVGSSATGVECALCVELKMPYKMWSKCLQSATKMHNKLRSNQYGEAALELAQCIDHCQNWLDKLKNLKHHILSNILLSNVRNVLQNNNTATWDPSNHISMTQTPWLLLRCGPNSTQKLN